MMTEPAKPKIIFVYNADSGAFNLLSDIAAAGKSKMNR
jgi:hypothetical protein